MRQYLLPAANLYHYRSFWYELLGYKSLTPPMAM
jgi:hypothetical protein